MKIKIYIDDQFYKEIEIEGNSYEYGRLVDQVARELGKAPGEPFKVQVVRESA